MVGGCFAWILPERGLCFLLLFFSNDRILEFCITDCCAIFFSFFLSLAAKKETKKAGARC